MTHDSVSSCPRKSLHQACTSPCQRARFLHLPAQTEPAAGQLLLDKQTHNGSCYSLLYRQISRFLNSPQRIQWVQRIPSPQQLSYLKPPLQLSNALRRWTRYTSKPIDARPEDSTDGQNEATRRPVLVCMCLCNPQCHTSLQSCHKTASSLPFVQRLHCAGVPSQVAEPISCTGPQ
jgi:hypothetical protein